MEHGPGGAIVLAARASGSRRFTGGRCGKAFGITHRPIEALMRNVIIGLSMLPAIGVTVAALGALGSALR